MGHAHGRGESYEREGAAFKTPLGLEDRMGITPEPLGKRGACGGAASKLPQVHGRDGGQCARAHAPAQPPRRDGGLSRSCPASGGQGNGEGEDEYVGDLIRHRGRRRGSYAAARER